MTSNSFKENKQAGIAVRSGAKINSIKNTTSSGNGTYGVYVAKNLMQH